MGWAAVPRAGRAGERETGQLNKDEHPLCGRHLGGYCPFALKLGLVAVERLLPTIFEIVAGMMFRHAML